KQERLQVVIRNAQGQPLRDASLQGVLYRPSSKAADLPLQMKEIFPGHYSTTLTPTLPGHWELRLSIQQENAHYRYVQRLQVAAEGE
uniref:FixH family protein n=1 Tax=Candidatus Magnetaquicoccus inordinatus TaxID=2496818 RepID=UPI00187D4AFA